MAKKIAVVSGKGGTGKSTLCTVLAGVMTGMGKKVLLLDCDSGLGSLDIMLGVQEKVLYNWGDVICGACRFDDAVTEITPFCSLLAAPLSWDDRFTPEAFREVLLSYEDSFDYILIDAPAGTGRGFRLAAANADMALLVAAAETVSIRSCHAAADRLFEMEIPEIYLILNKFDCWETKHGANLDIDAVIDGAGVQLRGIVPFSADASQLSMYGRAIPKRSKMFAAVERIMKRLEGEDLPLKRLEKI